MQPAPTPCAPSFAFSRLRQVYVDRLEFLWEYLDKKEIHFPGYVDGARMGGRASSRADSIIRQRPRSLGWAFPSSRSGPGGGLPRTLAVGHLPSGARPAVCSLHV